MAIIFGGKRLPTLEEMTRTRNARLKMDYLSRLLAEAGIERSIPPSEDIGSSAKPIQSSYIPPVKNIDHLKAVRSSTPAINVENRLIYHGYKTSIHQGKRPDSPERNVEVKPHKGLKEKICNFMPKVIGSVVCNQS